MNAALTTDTNQATASTALWRVAAAFMHILHGLFGTPSDVAGQNTLTLKAHRLMALWLRRAEAIMRRLLLIEAQKFAKPNTRPLLREPRKHKRKLKIFTADTPHTWRVSFQCFLERRLPAGKAAPTEHPHCRLEAGAPRRRRLLRSTPPPPRAYVYRRRTHRNRYPPMLRQDRPWVVHQEREIFRSAWPLAERYEAVSWRKRGKQFPQAVAR